MLCVGILYISFEKSILSSSASGGLATPTIDGLSRSILGMQVGLIMLAMIVTRSSVASLQGKRGLPIGNQALGWVVLGRPKPYKIGIV